MGSAKQILSLLFLIFTISLWSQSRSQLRDMFTSAEVDMLYEEYKEALPKYMSLLQIYPDNYNLYYRIGECYLHMTGEKDKAIPYLESAADNINLNYRKGRLREKGAPYEALYSLANAYRIAADFDRALETYDLFLKGFDTEKYDTALVRFQIETCHNAREMIRNPVFVITENLGNPINGPFHDFNPVLSVDEKTLVFTRSLQFYDAIFWSRKIEGEWSEPVNLTPELGIDRDYYSSSLSADGKTLLMYRIDDYDGNIYLSQRQGESWGKVEKLNSNINTKFWESHATLNSDGSKLYFSSNRRESLGGLDIFVSERDSSGGWGAAINLGSVINTPYDEDTPFLANNDSTLFFSSRGHHNMGGYDIFRSDLNKNGRWSKPVNLGYPINTTDDDLFFIPVGKGNRGYFARHTHEGHGMTDIFSCEIYSVNNPRRYIVTGQAEISSLLDEFLQPVEVIALNEEDDATPVTVLTDPSTGLYSLRLPAGIYDMRYESEDALTVMRSLSIPDRQRNDTVRIEPVMLPAREAVALFRLPGDTVISVTGAKKTTIELLAETRSLLSIELLSPDSLCLNEQHILYDTLFTFAFVPEKGSSRVSFRLTDRFGNDTSAVVTVHRTDRSEIGEMLENNSRAGLTAVKNSHPSSEVERELSSEIAVTEKVTASFTVTPDAEELQEKPGTDNRRGSGCRWLWPLIVASLLLLLLVIARKKKKQHEEK